MVFAGSRIEAASHWPAAAWNFAFAKRNCLTIDPFDHPLVGHMDLERKCASKGLGGLPGGRYHR